MNKSEIQDFIFELINRIVDDEEVLIWEHSTSIKKDIEVLIDETEQLRWKTKHLLEIQ